MISFPKRKPTGASWKWFALIVLVVLLVNAAIYAAIGLGIYYFFQWLGQQL